MLSEKAVVKVGDFVEAVFVADPSMTRRGVVVEVIGPKTVMVQGPDYKSQCDNPRIIPDSKLTPKDHDLRRMVAEKHLDKGGNYAHSKR
ncbi:MAG: hypothetical protein NTZ49_01875 [Candidatus Parcubacteria bacterium]|nr:hypothetical protein [Candidatus Parcubacteria bacterium]